MSRIGCFLILKNGVQLVIIRAYHSQIIMENAGYKVVASRILDDRLLNSE